MNRADFLAAAFMVSLSRHAGPLRLARGDVRDDPASSSQMQALRVLLGKGRAQGLDGQTFLFDGRRYRGSFSYADDGRVVSLVPIEAYLSSVVPREMPHAWPAAALAAQAIVARTFVLQRSNPARQYDLVPSESDQVYTGIDAEHPETTAAVGATAGQVLRFGDGFAQVMYSSCCGGHTESNADAWGGRLLEYLSGVSCTYCTDSPWYTWTKSVPVAQIESALTEQLAPIGPLQTIALQGTDASGRARAWRFQGSAGDASMKAEDVRRLLGTRTLPSLLVRKLTLDAPATQAQAGLTIEGGGLGHGVGLCQWGARGMALSGCAPRAILARYFPGTGIGND